MGGLSVVEQMSKLILALALVAATNAVPITQAKSLWTYGHAAYTYGPLHCTGNPCDVVPSCNKAHWKSDIENFNTDTSISNATISTVYSYGGDVEFWAMKQGGTVDPQACWAPAKDGACNFTSYYDPNNK